MDAGIAPFDEKRAPLGVVIDELDRAIAVPAAQRLRLKLTLAMRKLYLQYGGAAIPQRCWKHD